MKTTTDPIRLALVVALQQAIDYIEAGYPHEDHSNPSETITTIVDDGPEFVFEVAAARRAIADALDATLGHHDK